MTGSFGEGDKIEMYVLSGAWGGLAKRISGFSMRPGMVCLLGGERCVVLGPDTSPPDERHGEWLVMACTGEWEEAPHEDAMYSPVSARTDELVLDVDDPAFVGCLLALLGLSLADIECTHPCFVQTPSDQYLVRIIADNNTFTGRGETLGRACIAAAAAVGRWPDGKQ